MRYSAETRFRRRGHKVRRRTLIGAMGIGPRVLLREKGTPYKDLGLDDLLLSGEQLIDAMLQHPILMNRPRRNGRTAAGHSSVPISTAPVMSSAHAAREK